MGNRGYHDGWRLQVLTDLTQLPDYEPGWDHGGEAPRRPGRRARGPPSITASRSRSRTPRTTASAGVGRWRRRPRRAPHFVNTALMHRAGFWHQQFGVQTLAASGFDFGGPATATSPTEAGPFALHTLGDDETIARLATGRQAVHAPRRVQPDPALPAGRRVRPGATPTTPIRPSRRPSRTAASTTRRPTPGAPASSSREHGPTSKAAARPDRRPLGSVRADDDASRPARGPSWSSGSATATTSTSRRTRSSIPKLLDDVKAYMKSGPEAARLAEARHREHRLPARRAGPETIRRPEGRGLGPRPEAPARPLRRPGRRRHPVAEAGAYLVTAKMAGGNTSRVVVWVADTVILKKPMADSAVLLRRRRRDGPARPARQRRVLRLPDGARQGQRSTGSRPGTSPSSPTPTARSSPAREPRDGFQWVAVARTDEGRFAYLGFSNVWHSGYYD